jgi:Peptidase M15
MMLRNRSTAILLVAASSMTWASGALAGRVAVRASASRPIVIQPAVFVNLAARIGSGYGVVTSEFRTVAHNRLVGGVPNSLHLVGRAIDIQRRPGVSHRMIDAAMRQAGLPLVESLDEGDHSHFAFAMVTPAVLPPMRPAMAGVASAPLVPAKPAGPRVAADEHGLLLIDLPAGVRAGGIGGN